MIINTFMPCANVCSCFHSLIHLLIHLCIHSPLLPSFHPLLPPSFHASCIHDVRDHAAAKSPNRLLTPHYQFPPHAHVAGIAHNSSSNHLPHYSQPGSMQQQQQQQPSHHDAASAPQPPVGASFLPPSSSTFLAGNHFGGNTGSGSVSIHLPLGVSHVDPDGYLTSPPGQAVSVNPIQTGMGSLTNPSHSGLSNAHQLAFGKPVQTGMGDPNQAGELYHRPTSGQPLGARQNMQVV